MGFPSTPWWSMTDLAHRDAAIAELGPVLRPFHEHHPDGADTAILEAYRLAERMHRGQFRKSGEPFIVHPIAVTAVLADYGLDVETLVAALLHDTVEDTDLTLDEVRQRFGEQVALMIDGVTKLDRIKFGSQEEAQAATIRKMVVAMAQDVRVLLIKLADRLHNLRTIAALRPEKQQRIAKETLEVYAPLAHRLGMEEVKHEMEDRCFAVLQPLRYEEIQEQLAATDAGAGCLSGEGDDRGAGGAAVDAGVDASVTGRPEAPLLDLPEDGRHRSGVLRDPRHHRDPDHHRRDARLLRRTRRYPRHVAPGPRAASRTTSPCPSSTSTRAFTPR